MLTDISCEYFNNSIYRSFYFQFEWFFYLMIINIILNIFIEKKIEKENFRKRVLKVTFLQLMIFIIAFTINAYILYKSIC